MKNLIWLVVGFCCYGLISALDAKAEYGVAVCRGPIPYEIEYWSGSQTATFITVRFIADNRGDIGSLAAGHCRMEDGSPFEDRGHALLIANDYLEAPFYIHSRWDSGGRSPSVILRSGTKNLSLFFNHLHGDLSNTGLRHFRMLVSRPSPSSMLLIKSIQL